MSDRIAVKHDWWNSRILKMTSEGLGKLTASLSYFSGHPGRKEVISFIDFSSISISPLTFCCIVVSFCGCFGWLILMK